MNAQAIVRCIAVFIHGLFCVDGAIRRKESSISNLWSQLSIQDVQNCPKNSVLFRHSEEPLPVGEYQAMVNFVERKYRINLGLGNFVEGGDMFSTLHQGELVLWGNLVGATIEMSFYNNETYIEDQSKNGDMAATCWQFVPPSDKNFGEIRQTTFLYGDRVFFIGPRYDIFSHFLIDNVGYISYLRDILPPEKRIILADGRMGSSRKQLEFLDAEFAKRVDWIQCHSIINCNHLVKIRDGNLSVLRPISSTRHADLLLRARQWILEKNPPKDESLRSRTIIFYTRNVDNASHGRVVDLQQEREMIRIIKRVMMQNNLKERLVVFDGTESLREQMDLFQSANAVIGPHGGGLANLLFLLPSGSGETRPKVLEFITSSNTPKLHSGIIYKTFYHIFSSCSWAEYYHLNFVAPSSDSGGAFINMNDFYDAVRFILGKMSEENKLEKVK